MTTSTEHSDQQDGRPAADVREFANLFTEFMIQMKRSATGEKERLSEVGELVREELNHDPLGLDLSAEVFEPHQLADVEAAISAVADRHHGRWVGLRAAHRQHIENLTDFLGLAFGGSIFLGPLSRTRVAVGSQESRSVISFGLVFASMPSGRVACLLRAPDGRIGRTKVTLDLLAVDPMAIEEFMAEVRAALEQDSSLRGHVLSLERNPFDQFDAESAVRFLPRPSVTADQVVLPDGVLERISRHVVGIREHRDTLLESGQHLKRGVLLYGPPGTGKTHVVRHLISSSPGVTAVLLTGRTLQYIGVATQLARAAQPALIVLEDCDLVAEERGGDTNAALFETLEAIDGLAGDADVAFVLTTNRPDLLERALVERPGRVDLAVEIGKPDEAARAALLKLYSPTAAAFSDALLSEIAARTEGATASFAKELMRRSVLLAASSGEPVDEHHLRSACDEMLSDAETFTRSLLGGGQDAANGS